MKQRIGALSIDGFRALRHLEINGLGRVNLITGRNNTGKSSVLEALRILASNGSSPEIYRILHYREEDIDEPLDTTRSEDGGFSIVSSLFSGFPPLGDTTKRITISASGAGRPHRLSLSIARFIEQQEPDGIRRLIPEQSGVFPDTESVPRLIVETEVGSRNLPLPRTGPRTTFYPIEESWISCVHLTPQDRTDVLGPLWDKIALSDQEKDVVEALRIITPEIVGVSMIGGGAGSRQPRIAIARASNVPRPVPLRSFGDGVNRLFGIVLSLVNAKDGLLLIDEVENGMHHTIQLDVWRAIFRLSRRLDVQVFATSHSWDSVESFQKAASEDPEEGVLVRLSRKGDDIVPTLLREDELAVATRDHIEVR